MKNSSTASCTMYIYFLIILWTGHFLDADGLVGSAELAINSCRLKNKTHGIAATCSHLRLTSIPTHLPRNTIMLDVSYNQIRVLRNDSFQSLQQLNTLSVRANFISDLEVGTFLPLTNLRTLDMTQNRLTHLQHNIFDANHLLFRLMLFSNNFTSVPTDALSRVPLLQSVFLADNSIQMADFTAFSHSSSISVIDLRHNAISSIEASDFKPLQNHSLKELSLNDNDLRSLPARLFSYLNRVRRLILDGNTLSNFNLSSFLGNMNIDKLSVYGCRIQNIVKVETSSLSNASFPAISFIEMSRNIIAYMPPYAFQGFNQTHKLKIQGNKITTMFVDSFCGLDSLIILDLSDNRINYLEIGMFSCNPQLQELILSQNEIMRLNLQSFQGLSVLHTLDLSHNYLKRADDRQQWANPELHFLNISGNNFNSLHPRLFSGNLSNLQILDVSYNNIRVYSEKTFNNVPSLQELYLISESKHIQRLNQVFSQMKNLKKLDISQGHPMFTSIHQFTETTSLQELRMCHNDLHHYDLFDKNVTQSSLFEGLVSLKKLNLMDNDLNGLEPGVFRPLIKLHSLDLSLCKIVYLKPGVFQGLTSLKNLYLNENAITTTFASFFKGLDSLKSLFFQNSRLQVLDKNLFVTTPNLHNLYLSGNHISKVHRETFFPTNYTLTIDISDNRFACTCELYWFITWLQNSDIILKRPNQTQCYNTSFKAVVGKPILTFVPADFCGVNILLISGMTFLAFSVSLSLVIAYNKRWWLNHKLFLLKLAIIGHQEMAEDFNADQYEFHLNLMFHEAEEEWVEQVMKPALEERLPHLQNIVYGDDYLPLGMYYINAIHDVIENSFKTVLLLSNRSIDDSWFMTKLRIALEHVNDTGLDKVILIFLEDIQDDHLPYLVRLFMSKKKPYILWVEDEDGQELFWAQFERSMRANKAINNAIPL